MQNIWTMDLSIKERVAQCTMKSLQESAGELCMLQTEVHFSTRVCVGDICRNSYIKPVFVLKEPYNARHQRRISIDTTSAFGYVNDCDLSAVSMCCHLCFVLRNVITAEKNGSLCPTPKILAQTNVDLFLWQCSDVVLINGPQSVTVFNVVLYRIEPVFLLDWCSVTIIPQSNNLA